MAEAELDLCAAAANALDSSGSDLDEASAFEEDSIKAKRIVMGGEESAGSDHASGSSSGVATGGFGEATEVVPPDDGSGDRRGTALEPGEVTV